MWCKNSDEGDASTDLPQSPLRETKTYSQDGKSAHPFHLLHVLLRYRLIRLIDGVFLPQTSTHNNDYVKTGF